MVEIRDMIVHVIKDQIDDPVIYDLHMQFSFSFGGQSYILCFDGLVNHKKDSEDISVFYR